MSFHKDLNYFSNRGNRKLICHNVARYKRWWNELFSTCR